MAYPKGEVLTGGTGKHHKDGTCAPKVAKGAAPAAKDAAKKQFGFIKASCFKRGNCALFLFTHTLDIFTELLL
jgi:hypothetical protein